MGTTLDILGSKVTIRTLRSLLRRPYQERFFKELVEEVHVGVGPLNSTLKVLAANDIVQEATIGKQHFYKANLQNPLTKALYDLFTMERKLDIPGNLRTALDEFVSKLRSYSKENLLSVILFGSVATGEAKPESDLDLLLVFDSEVAVPEEMHTEVDSLSRFYQVTVQEHSFSKSEFSEAYAQGDDMIVNALTDGIVLYDDGFIIPLLSKPLPRPSAMVAKQDLEEARKKIEDAKRNYRNESFDTTIMLLALAMSFGVRAYLIAKGEIPGSRHKLTMQLRKYDHANARLLDDLTTLRNAASHGNVHFDKESVWNMLRECEDFVRHAFEETNRRL